MVETKQSAHSISTVKSMNYLNVSLYLHKQVLQKVKTFLLLEQKH